MGRDNFPFKVVETLCKRAAYICSKPDCRRQTIAPSETDENKFVYVGKAAHICAAAPGGPRYDIAMTAEMRSAISNGIFLCSTCADLIDKNNGIDFTVKQLQDWKAEHEKWVTENLNKRPGGIGGDGGGGEIHGNRGTVIAGKGGKGGTGGSGGKGGSGIIHGDDGVIIGGDGGNAGTADGRGGNTTRGPLERLGISSNMWGAGRGGSGANHPEYDRRIAILKQIRNEYLTKFPDDARYIDAGIEQVPVDWINQRLFELTEIWKVEMGQTGYILPPLT